MMPQKGGHLTKLKNLQNDLSILLIYIFWQHLTRLVKSALKIPQ